LGTRLFWELVSSDYYSKYFSNSAILLNIFFFKCIIQQNWPLHACIPNKKKIKTKIKFSFGIYEVDNYPICRRLRVTIDRDLGGTSAAPKTIRFFVPYWIVNDSSLPLAYQVVEVEPLEKSDTDTMLLSRVVKSAKLALKHPTLSMDGRHAAPRRNIQVLEVIEDTTPVPSMLSPQDYAGRTGVISFTSNKDAHLSSRVGIAVAIRNSEIYSPGISLHELENKVTWIQS
jgi:hypothetical protein